MCAFLPFPMQVFHGMHIAEQIWPVFLQCLPSLFYYFL